MDGAQTGTLQGYVSTSTEGYCVIPGYYQPGKKHVKPIYMMVGTPESARKLALALIDWADSHETKK